MVTTSAARTTPRLVRFVAHVTRWNCGETLCTRFLDIVGVVRAGLSARAAAELYGS